MTTIYAVSTGSYSDYSIEAMFSTEEKAQQYMDRRREHSPYKHLPDFNDIETYELDTIDDDYLTGKVKYWRVEFATDSADVREVRLEDGEPNESVNVGSHRDRKWFVVYVFADTQERAVKVAMERRSVWLANQVEKVSE